eukprot:1139060-Pelagomonas_calceolata.AAC.11
MLERLSRAVLLDVALEKTGICFESSCSNVPGNHNGSVRKAQFFNVHSVQYAHKFVSTRRAIENKITSHSQALEPSASSNPPDPR